MNEKVAAPHNMLTIQLTAPAMEALFPEGSEARLSLKQSVVAEMCRRLVEKDAMVLANKFLLSNADDVRQIINQTAREVLGPGGEYAFAKPTAEFKNKVRLQAIEVADGVINDAITAAVSKYLDSEAGAHQLEERISSHVKKIEAMEVRRRVDEKVKAILGDAA